MRRLALTLVLTLAAGAAGAAGPEPLSRFHIHFTDLPEPHATPSAANPAAIVARSQHDAPILPPGWNAWLFADDLDHPRNLLVLPDGSVLVAEQRADRLTRLADGDGDGLAESRTVFATGFDEPYGLAFHDGQVWVADTKAVWRLDWREGAPQAGARTRVTKPGALGDDRGHSTRSLAIAPDGKHFYVGIGSRSNIAVEPAPRATIQEFAIDGSGQRTFASGLRNPVGMAFRPGSDELWAVVNERDGMGDELVPDYLAQIPDGAFFGWPYAYVGSHPQPGFAERQPTLVVRSRIPDVLFKAHSAPLGLAFLDGFAYVALHGSWNRSTPNAGMVARVPLTNDHPLGHYEVFASGFMIDATHAWGRPAGLAASHDGALYIADDAGRTVWKIAPEPLARPEQTDEPPAPADPGPEKP
jgi:glucose/arabinose dehydrogenase